MTFNEDKKIVNKNELNIFNSRLYLDEFKTHKTILSSLFSYHYSVLFFDFMLKKYPDLKVIKKDRINFAAYLFIFYCTISICEDLTYIFYRKNKDFGFLNIFKTYNSNLIQNIKNIKFKDIQEKQYKKFNTVSIMNELNELEKDYINKIGKLSNVSTNYLKDYEEIQQIKKEKKFLEGKLIELNKL
jgi:hypothetical protein